MKDALVKLIEETFDTIAPDSPTLSTSAKAGPKTLQDTDIDKIFELHALVRFMSKIRSMVPLCEFTLWCGGKPGSELMFQSAPGAADFARSHIRVSYKKRMYATLWTNVEFNGLSASEECCIEGSRHESDVLMLWTENPLPTGPFYPKHTQILASLECKFLGKMPKQVLRNLLGLRREMSWLQDKKILSPFRALDGGKAEFIRKLSASPPSHLIFCYLDHYKKELAEIWQSPADKFDIEFLPYKTI